MKSSAKPRRTKAEITEAKLKEAEKQMEIEMRLKRLEEMEQNMGVYYEKMEQINTFDTNVGLLVQNGLLKK